MGRGGCLPDAIGKTLKSGSLWLTQNAGPSGKTRPVGRRSDLACVARG